MFRHGNGSRTFKQNVREGPRRLSMYSIQNLNETMFRLPKQQDLKGLKPQKPLQSQPPP